MWRVLVPDNHPPLYYVLTKAFAQLAGYGDFAVRFLSVSFGTALVATLYALARRLSGPVGGIGAALYAACSPLYVYYAQEARMYSLLMVLAVLSSYSLVRVFERPDARRWWVTYVLATCGALYTHYFAVLLILVHQIAASVWLLVGRRKRWLYRWMWAGAGLLLLYLPWLPTAIRQVGIGQGTWWRVPLPASVVLSDLWRFYVLGPRRPVGVPLLGAVLGGTALALLAALLVGWRQRLWAWAFAVLSLLFPVAVVVITGSTWPIYTDRYALIAAPALAVLVGIGVAACWHAVSGARRWLGQLAALLLLATAIAGPLPQLVAYYTDHAYWREDFRRAAQYVMDSSGRGDAVVLLGSYQPIMQYYDRQAAVVRFPQQGDSVYDEEEVVRALNGAITPSSQVRLVMYSWSTVDPQGLVEGALRARCRLQGEHWQRESGQRPIRVLNFEACAPFEVQPREQIDATFGDQLALTAYRTLNVVPGRQAHVYLWWQTLRRPDKNYSAFVHLVGADGEIIAQFDHLPLSDFYPMRAWPIGVDHRDDYPFKVPAEASLQGAWLAIGLYDRASNTRLPVYVANVPVGDQVLVPLE
jgi:hypothetical protein